MKHIVLLSLDTLRYDCIGYQPDKKELLKHDVLKYLKTPTLDEISEKSLCFTRCISTNTYTTAAHASVLTGLYPSRHGVRAFYQSKLRKDVYSIAEILKVFGYTTILATDTPVNFLPLDMNKGFDHVFDKDDPGVFQFLEKYKNEKIFLFAHFFDIHDPYLFNMCRSYDNRDYFSTLKDVYKKCSIPFPSETTDAWHIWRNLNGQIGRRKDVMFPLYVQGVSKFDRDRFSTFFKAIKKFNLLDDGLLIIFSDHGEGRKSKENPDDFWHGGDVFDNVVRVPLLVYNREFPGKILDKTVSLVDIFPTVIENATGKSINYILPYSINGQTLLDPREREGAYCETSRSRNMLKSQGVQLPFLKNCTQMSSFILQRAIRTQNEKFIYYGEPESLPIDTIETMDNKEFLKAVYRKRMCKFERYDEYMRNLQMLNSGKITKRDFYQNHGGERFEIYDLEKDPYEENPLTELENPDVLSSYKTKIFELSTPSVVSEDIFPPLNKTVVKRIAKRLLAEEKIIIKERYIMELQNRIKQKKALLDQVFSSNTWKIGQLYVRFFGKQAKWRKQLSHLF